VSYDVPDQELMTPGHVACPGCGAPMAVRYALKALGEDTVLIVVASCWSIIAGPFPYSAVKVPLLHSLFATGGSVASGVKAGLEARGLTDTTVMTLAGDGGTFDIGIPVGCLDDHHPSRASQKSAEERHGGDHGCASHSVHCYCHCCVS